VRTIDSCALAGTLTLLSALDAGLARADDAAAAEAMFLEAKELANAGEWAEACPKFEASYKLERALGTLLNVANCHEQVGRVASAWSELGEALEWARREGDDREAFAAERRAALEPRVPHLTIDVARPAPGLSVYRGDEVIDPRAYGTPLPTDPGLWVVTVRRGDQELTRQEVRLVEGARVELALDLEAIDRAAPAPPPATPPPKPRPEAPPPEPFWNAQRTTGLIVGAVGVAGLASFGVLEGIAISKKADADETGSCFEGFCTPEGARTSEDAETFAEAGQWVGIGGAVVLAVGVTLFLTAGGSAPAPAAQAQQRALLVPVATSDGGGLLLRGTL
jgi:hypothetical protein